VLDHGVKTGAGPSVGTGKLLGSIEFVFKVDLLLGLIVVELGAVVEALDGSIGGRDEGRSGEEGGRETHGRLLRRGRIIM